MSFFPWSEEYSVHLRVIDNDHKDLVATVNALHDAIRDGSAKGEIGHIIGNLAHYVDDHFAREEALMEAYDYPGLADHKRIHRHLTRMVYAIRMVFASKPMEIDPAKLLRFLRDWLVHHILEEDRKYVPFLRGDDGGRAATGRLIRSAALYRMVPRPLERISRARRLRSPYRRTRRRRFVAAHGFYPRAGSRASQSKISYRPSVR